MDFYITYRQSQIFCRRIGNGPKFLLCFHGYGETSASFDVLESKLGHEYTVYAFDLPLHGKTRWQEGMACSPEMWLEIVQHCIPDNRKVTYLGYSMGGRVALSLFQLKPELCNRLLLVAPDGLTMNTWYWLSTQTRLGNRLFRYTANNPNWLISLMGAGKRLRLLNKSIHKIAHFYLDDDEQRSKLYERWTMMRRFKPRLDIIKDQVLSHEVKLVLLFGRFDKIILSAHGQQFIQGIEEFAQVRIINAGHQLLKEKYVPVITELMIE
jgi:pimeloyl-ACP methyl ester carboxylesterase